MISISAFVEVRESVAFSLKANRLATVTVARLTAGPRNKGHVITDLRAPEVPLTPTSPGVNRGRTKIVLTLS